MLSLLLELQRLKRLDRTGWVLRGLPPGAESVAAHSYGVALAAMMLADECASRCCTTLRRRERATCRARSRTTTARRRACTPSARPSTTSCAALHAPKL